MRSEGAPVIHSIANKNASVIVIDSRVDIRAMVRECVKGLGFPEVILAGNISEAWSVFENSEKIPTWVICSLLGEEKENAMHILGLLIKEPVLQECRVSLLLQPEELYVLPDAFGLGLLSYHLKPFTLGSLKGDLDVLVKSLVNDLTGGCFTASKYLRRYLMEVEQFETLIYFEENMMKFFPDNSELFLSLAEAQQMAGKNTDARKTLTQAKYLNARIEKGAKQLLDVMEEDPNAKDKTAELTFAQAFDVKTCVIVDPDETSTKILKEGLISLGVSQIEVFLDGEAAWNWLVANPPPQILLHEWKLPKLSGASLLQRYRQSSPEPIPILIVSSLVKAKDLPVLREMGVSQIVEKPIDREAFISILMATMRQEKFPKTYKVLERKIHLELEKGDMVEAKRLKQLISVATDTPKGSMKAIDAEFAFYDGKFDEAKALAFEALKSNGDSLFIVNLLGKIFLKTRVFEEAIKCFNKVQEMSSQNLMRLCQLAEAQTEVGNFEQAHQTLDAAKAIDKDNEQLKFAEAKLALSEGDKDQAKSMMKNIDNLNEVVAYTNNRAVALAKANQLQESRDLYSRALESLPSDEENLRALLLYNLGLSHVRSNDLVSGEKVFEKALELKKSEVYAKAASMQSRIKQCIATGKPMILRPAEVSANTDKNSATHGVHNIMALNLKPGEACLHQIFANPSGLNPQVLKMLDKFPHFSRAVKKSG